MTIRYKKAVALLCNGLFISSISLSVEYEFMLYVNTSILPAVFHDSLTRLESLLFAVLALDERYTKFLTDFQRNEKCFCLKSFHCLLFLSFILFAA